jgi:hypothetical protein
MKCELRRDMRVMSENYNGGIGACKDRTGVFILVIPAFQSFVDESEWTFRQDLGLKWNGFRLKYSVITSACIALHSLSFKLHEQTRNKEEKVWRGVCVIFLN